MAALFAALAFLSIYALHVPFPLIVLGAALAGFVLHALGRTDFAAAPEADEVLPAPAPRPLATAGTALLWLGIWLLPTAALIALLGPHHVFAAVSLFFVKLAAVTFGGAYAALAYVAQEAVSRFGWLKPGEMMDGLGLAETTPGPLVLVLEYVGFMAAYRAPGPLDPLLSGTLGALAALWATFAPSFLWIFVGAPYIERLRASRALHAALTGVTAAIVGVILNLSLWFGLHVLFGEVVPWRAGPLSIALPVPGTLDGHAAALSALAILLLFVLRLGPFVTLGLCAGLGFAWRLLGG